MSINTTLIAGHKIIVDPENTHEVSKVIGRASLDVGALCAAGANYVNKWARYKPVKNSANNYRDQLKGGTGADKNKWATNATWWKAANGLCGLSVNKYDNGANMVANWNKNWVYDAITINSNRVASHWCRLTDFNYYDHNANPPLFVGYPSQYSISMSQNLNVQFQAYNGNEYALMLTDFTNGIWNSQAQMYCGVLVVYGTPNHSYANKTKVSVVNGTPLGTNMSIYGKYQREVSVPYSLLNIVSTPCEIEIYPFLCQNAYSNQKKGANEDVGWTYYVVPCPCQPAIIEAVMGYITGVLSNVSCNFGQGGNSVQLAFTYTITGGGGGFQKNDLTAWLYVLDNDLDTSGQYPEYKKKNGHCIISYGTALNNPCRGKYFGSITVSDGHSQSFDQTTLMNDVSSYLVVGIDATTYVNEYRAKHGSGSAKVTLVVEFQDNANGWYGTATMSDVIISGSY